MLPPSETWLCWKVCEADGEGDVRLLTPCSDPDLYEYAAEGLFKTEAEAVEYLENFFPDEDTSSWVLVEMTFKPVKRTQDAI